MGLRLVMIQSFAPTPAPRSQLGRAQGVRRRESRAGRVTRTSPPALALCASEHVVLAGMGAGRREGPALQQPPSPVTEGRSGCGGKFTERLTGVRTSRSSQVVRFLRRKRVRTRNRAAPERNQAEDDSFRGCLDSTSKTSEIWAPRGYGGHWGGKIRGAVS